MKQWGDKKDCLYYIIEFGALRRINGESVFDFSKRFNKMYNKTPSDIKPTKTFSKITYANAFEFEFSLILRETRSATLSDMKASAIEVEPNMLVVEKLKTRSDRGEIDKVNKKKKLSLLHQIYSLKMLKLKKCQRSLKVYHQN